jgi:DNA-binding SARP family transcriptional activator
MNSTGSSIALFLLGRFEARGVDGPMRLSSKKMRALLAYLACGNGEAHARSTLMTLLWGSHSEAQARQSLRQTLVQLRRVLGQDAIVSDGDFISLRASAITSDVSQFEILAREHNREALIEATQFYRGRFLADLAITEEGWTDWLRTERQRLEDLAIEALIRLAEQHLELGNAKDALASAKRAISIEAFREDAHRLAMRAAAATGNRALALRQFRELSNFLRQEMDVDPDVATLALVSELRSSPPPTNEGHSLVPISSSRRTSLLHRPNMDWHPPCRLAKWHG